VTIRTLIMMKVTACPLHTSKGVLKLFILHVCFCECGNLVNDDTERQEALLYRSHEKFVPTSVC